MRYETPSTTREAAALLASERGRCAFVLAGGTDLLVRMKLGHIEPALLVDIKRIPAMRSITHSASGMRIGAAVSGAELGEHKTLASAWPGVVEATNLDRLRSDSEPLHYGGQPVQCIPGSGQCPRPDSGRRESRGGEPTRRRTVAVEKIVTGPGQTSLAKGEVIEAIILPARPARSGDAYLRFIPRTEMDIAVVSAGVNLTLERGRVKTPGWCLVQWRQRLCWCQRRQKPSSAPGWMTMP